MAEEKKAWELTQIMKPPEIEKARPSLFEQANYWRRQLHAAPVGEVPGDLPRPPASSFVRAHESAESSTGLLSEVRSFCQRENVCLLTVLLTALKVLLLRYTGRDDIAVGSLSSHSVGETEHGVQEVFANILALRTSLSGNPSARECVQRVARTVAEAARHRDYLFERLVEEVVDRTDLHRAPFFQVMLVLCDESCGLAEVPIVARHLASVEEHTTRCDLVVLASEVRGKLRLDCEYDAEVFVAATIRRLLEHFTCLLEGVVANAGRKPYELPLLTKSERHQLLVEWNNTKRDWPTDNCIHQLFEAQVEKSPEAIALVLEDKQLTYRELNRRANQLARHLRTLGVGPDSLVGICMPYSAEMVTALLAILKAGGAYIPLDPTYPKDRLAFMLEDSRAEVLLTQQELAESFPEHAAYVVCLDKDWKNISDEEEDDLVNTTTADNLAYVIYTSGSTGRPKEVGVYHRGFTNLLNWFVTEFHIANYDKVLLVSSFSFDLTQKNIFAPLIVGAQLYMLASDYFDSRAIVQAVAKNQITLINCTPSAFYSVVDAANDGSPSCLGSLRCVLLGGEAISVRRLWKWLGSEQVQTEVVNTYGPTECADVCAFYRLHHFKQYLSSPVPIGKPISNAQLFILDKYFAPAPVGVAGELCVSGVGLGAGYLNDAKLTAERFIPHPFGREAGEQLYRTGDLARYLPSGDIEYLGRMDHQVKLRGFRVEPGEIEAVLAQHLAVRETVVIAREDQPTDKRLVAYVVPNQECTPTASELRSFLKEKLPEYMIPSAYVLLESLPLTPNGKVDRRNLPAPDRGRPELANLCVAPRTSMEETLAEIWGEVLELQKVGVYDNFFDLGGNSLLLGSVRAKLEDRFGQQLFMTEMFQYPNIASLAAYLRQKSGETISFAESQIQTGVQSSATLAKRDTSIAIIGMAGKFPGAKDLDTFWQNLRDGVESVSFFSEEELLSAGIDPALLRDPSYVKANALLSDIEMFDASFFGVSPREAELMDPQQRLFLECAWEALENAGYGADTRRVPVGVFAGVGMNKYLLHNVYPNTKHLGPVDTFQVMISNDKDFLPTRVSYKLNLKGPSINVQTACSTSLAAVHLACQSLLYGECDMALAGGVSALVLQKSGYLYQEGMILSPDGHCRAFDAAARGTVLGSGVGIVILKRLADAIADGDHIRAIIKGSAINNDGSAKVGYTAPSVDGQSAVIAKAQANAGVEAETISYVEAHGTATALGDPIEIAALTRVFRVCTEKNGFCAIGAVKSNIGHVDAAAGVAGLIKTVLALEHKLLPPSLHFKEPNPQIDFANSPFYVNTKLSEWNSTELPRRAGVSSFGIGGTNCHIILEENLERGSLSSTTERLRHVLTLSAKSEEALKQLTGRYAQHLASHPELNIGDVCFTANTGRTHFEHRLAVVAESIPQLQSRLAALDAQPQRNEVLRGTAHSSKPPKMAFLFTGQGSQYVGMGRELYETQPTFRENLEHCDSILRPYLACPLPQVLYPELGQKSFLDETVYTQPVLFALEYALAQLWRSWGIEPSAVLGHSVGEYVAACVAGVFSLEDGLKLIAERGRLMQALPQDGEMVVVLSDEARVAAAIQPYQQEISIAALNGRQSIVLSGRRQAVQAVRTALQAQGIQTQPLRVSHAFHSPLMEPMLAPFARAVSAVSFRSPKISLISNVTGNTATAEITTTAYWCRHIRQPVRFAASMETLRREGYEIFLEVGPQPILSGLGRQCLPNAQNVWLPSLRQGKSDWEQILESLAALHVRGVAINWSGFHQDYSHRRVELPTYPFQRQKYWIEAPASDSVQRSVNAPHAALHPLLGQRLRLPLSPEIRFETRLSLHSPPYIQDHRIFGQLVVAGASHVAMFLLAVHEAFGADCCVLEDLLFQQPLTLSEHGARTAQVVITPQGPDRASLSLLSLRDNTKETDPTAWLVHATGKINLLSGGKTLSAGETLDVALVQARCSQVISGAEFYQRIWIQGRDAGPSFRWIKNIWQGAGEALCQTQYPNMAEDISSYQLHPGLIEACFQLLRCCKEYETAELTAKTGYRYVPFRIDSVNFYGPPKSAELWCYAQMRQPERLDGESVVGDFRLFDETGQLLAEILGFEERKLTRESLQRHSREEADGWVYKVTWQPKVLAGSRRDSPPAEPGEWLIFADSGEMGSNLALQLRERGEDSILIFPGDNYKRTDNGNYSLNPAEPRDFQRFFQELSAHHRLLHRGIVYLWGLKEYADEPTLGTLQDAQRLGCGGALHLVQAVVQSGWSVSRHLWFVTRGSLAVGPAGMRVHHAPLWGLGHVVSLEHPELHCVRLDLDPSDKANDVRHLFSELSTADNEGQIAYRQGIRHAARLRRHRFHAPKRQRRPLVDPSGSYLITGGLGALGLKVAHWLIAQGARHLVLTGRHGVTSTAQQAVIKELQKAEARVLIMPADVSQPAAVACVLETIENTLPPLRGIVHAAGVLDDGILLQQNWQRFTRVMAPKVSGAWNLHTLTQTLPLDFFVCFSSAASMLGSRGQANYAAANAFLDALAHYRRAQGLPGLSINWGPWADVGMAAALNQQNQRRMMELGWQSIAPEQGVGLLGQLLGEELTQVAVLPITWPKFLEQFSSHGVPSFFSELELSMTLHVQSQQFVERKELLRRWQQVSSSNRLTLAIQYIQEQVAQILGIAPNQPEPDQSFLELGMDSLMQIQLRNCILRDLEVEISVRTVFEQSTVTKLAVAITELDAELSKLADVARILAEINSLSDEEAQQQMLDQKK